MDHQQTQAHIKRDVVIFTLGSQRYALSVESIVRIIEMVAITPLPQVNGPIEGVINVRGEAVPIINMRALFRLPRVPFHLHTPIILTRVSSHTFGLIVDEVVDVTELPAGQIFPLEEILPPGWGEAPALYGLAHIQVAERTETVLLLDLEYMLSPEQFQVLMAALAELEGMEGMEGVEAQCEHRDDQEEGIEQLELVDQDPEAAAEDRESELCDESSEVAPSDYADGADEREIGTD